MSLRARATIPAHMIPVQGRVAFARVTPADNPLHDPCVLPSRHVQQPATQVATQPATQIGLPRFVLQACERVTAVAPHLEDGRRIEFLEESEVLGRIFDFYGIEPPHLRGIPGRMG